MAKKKAYTVWAGREPGVYDTWARCQEQTAGFKGARFQGFASRAQAEAAFLAGDPDGGVPANTKAGDAPRTVASEGEKTRRSADSAAGRSTGSAAGLSTGSAGGRSANSAPGRPAGPALCVDAACDARRWIMEYRAVRLDTGEEVFAEGPFERANANFGEFLAIVDALRRVADGTAPPTIYSDSLTARAWVRKRALNSGFLREGKAGPEVSARLEDALAWLKARPADTKDDIRVWETRRWGEIPADYGRKGN